ncbi:MAG: hypothetical protein U1E29_11215 [Coriobacteriia bacterium]|nr:hypothetical protein [Coriobacteriia bacterium]
MTTDFPPAEEPPPAAAVEVAGSPLTVESVTRVDGGAGVEAVVRVSSAEFMRTRDVPGLAVRALEAFPELRRHKCDCGSARGIESELANTESPHLLEHLALELLALGGASRRETRGETSWDFARDGRGVFRVRIEHGDPVATESALREACAAANALLSGETVPRRE